MSEQIKQVKKEEGVQGEDKKIKKYIKKRTPVPPAPSSLSSQVGVGGMSWQEQTSKEAGRLLAQEGERYRLGTAVGVRLPAVDSAAGFGWLPGVCALSWR